MDKHIRDWIAQMVGRDNRMLDVNIMRNLTRASQFFASTTMLILGALVALMGYAEKAAGVLAELPFTQQVSEHVRELKILLLVVIFVFAFFKLCVVDPPVRARLGAGRRHTKAASRCPNGYAAHIDRIARLASFASGNFNNGLRAYYFGVAALSWFLHPVLMIS